MDMAVDTGADMVVIHSMEAIRITHITHNTAIRRIMVRTKK